MDEISDVGIMRELAAGGLVALNAFRHHERPHVDPDEERFETDAVIFTLGGTWTFSGPRGSVDADPGAVVVARAGDRFAVGHRERVPTDRTFEVAFRPPDGSPGPDTRIPGAFARHGVPRTPAMRRLQAALWREAHDREPTFELKVDLLALQLLVEIARVNDRVQEAEGRLPTALRDGVQAARRHMDEHLDDRLTLDELARVALVSPFHLARGFRAELGISPHQYLLRARIERAAELLTETDLSVTRIGELVGFASPAHLTRTFAQRMGMPPSVYRRSFGRPR